jgi:hypothetical protein
MAGQRQREREVGIVMSSTYTSGALVRRILTLAMLAMAAGPALAQGGPPPNATAQRYGDGWTCDPGYRERGGACEAVAIPENAYPADTRYGQRGWECARGFALDGGKCLVIQVPEHAYLDGNSDR